MIAEGAVEIEPVEPGLRGVIPRQRYDDPEYIFTTTEVLDAMWAIEGQLAGAGLEHLIPFNEIYRNLTTRVVEHIEFSKLHPDDETAFQHPETVERTIGIFADFWWKQLRAYTGITDEKVDPAWQFLLYRETAPNAVEDIQPYAEKAEEELMDGVLFLLGMNAHINYDLAQALRASGVTEDYYEDYRKVIGMLINEIASKFSADYIPGPQWTRQILQWGTERTIAHWREQAWKAGKDLMRSEDEIAVDAILGRLDRTSVRTGKRLAKVGNAALRGYP